MEKRIKLFAKFWKIISGGNEEFSNIYPDLNQVGLQGYFQGSTFLLRFRTAIVTAEFKTIGHPKKKST
jgi:hypothetical protein